MDIRIRSCARTEAEKTEKMIEKAIRLGFTDYCITEHAPLPAGFETSYEGPGKGMRLHRLVLISSKSILSMPNV